MNEKLIAYFNKLGVCLTEKHCNDIILIITGVTKAEAKLHRYNAQNDYYELVRTKPTTDEAIKKAIQTALDEGPAYKFNRWDLYNSKGEFEGHIFTTSISIL